MYVRVLLLVLLLPVAPAIAQDIPPPEATHMEIGFMWWKPDPGIVISSGNLSTDIDFVQDLGIGVERFREIRAVIKPGLKHKIRFAYVPVRYDRQGQVLNRAITFRGATYNVNLPVNTSINWDFYRVGYEWDFVSGRHGYFGVFGDMKYNRLAVQVSSPIGTEQTVQNVPVPTIGGVGRVYFGDYTSVTGEYTALKFTRTDFNGNFFDFDVYGQLNFNRNAAAQVGYRRVKVDYFVNADDGDLKLEGIYFGGLVRF